jgi:hypothetical protein
LLDVVCGGGGELPMRPPPIALNAEDHGNCIGCEETAEVVVVVVV